jgi:hypothetical protein
MYIIKHNDVSIGLFTSYTAGKLMFNQTLKSANINDLLQIVHMKHGVIYEVWNEGYHKGKITVDRTYADLV